MTKDIKIALSGHFQQFSLIWVQQCTQKLRICDIVKKFYKKRLAMMTILSNMKVQKCSTTNC